MIVNYADHSANERTFLAWVRTAIAVVGFGVAATRLGPDPVSGWSEALLLMSGAVVILIAFLRLRRVRARISASAMLEDDALAADGLLMALIVALFGMLAAFALHVG
ncbi:YidH family protein [Pseudorhodobacter sp. W20_MBD10_FR17]|uniref:YidH family protein n=1 Tax=Pseudorhodobacter sp. W20_MBD10_FR17 TaxID=3240266 RepID=UPI003F9A9268